MLILFDTYEEKGTSGSSMSNAAINPAHIVSVTPYRFDMHYRYSRIALIDGSCITVVAGVHEIQQRIEANTGELQVAANELQPAADLAEEIAQKVIDRLHYGENGQQLARHLIHEVGQAIANRFSPPTANAPAQQPGEESAPHASETADPKL